MQEPQPHVKALKLPITNVYAKGDYCATFHLGSQQTPVNLILDTGSSTLVVKDEVYQASQDKSLTSTAIAQEVNYGIGGWNGPLVHTNVTLENTRGSAIVLANASLALVTNKAQFATFAKADGFVGLAYHHLNKGFDVTEYLTKHNVTPAQTYPWPFDVTLNPELEDSSDLTSFKHFLWKYPEQDITPYFTELSNHQLSANKFGFYSKRSAIHQNENTDANTSSNTLAQDPLNQGWLIIGGGEEQTELYQGDFSQIKVEHDVYYNVELVSVQVGDKAPIKAAPLQADKVKSYFTNAIIDTGAGLIVLTADIYQQVINDLSRVNTTFAALLNPFKDYTYQEVGINADKLKLEQWPDIIFTFVADITNQAANNKQSSQQKQTVQLRCSPQTYWQVNTPSFGKACFRFLSQLPQWPNQSIIGLPLLNNYYVVFDRAVDGTGVINFAQRQ